MKVLIDTHALIWWSEDDPRLGGEARAVFEERENTVFVSAVSIYEMRLKENRGKLRSARRMLSDLDGYFRDQGMSVLALEARHADLAGRLPLHHRDPFDRMLIAQALAENLPLVSNERLFDDFGVRRLW